MPWWSNSEEDHHETDVHHSHCVHWPLSHSRGGQKKVTLCFHKYSSLTFSTGTIHVALDSRLTNFTSWNYILKFICLWVVVVVWDRLYLELGLNFLLFEVTKEVWPSVWQDHCDLLSRISEGCLQKDNQEHHPGQQEHLQLAQVPAVLLCYPRLCRLHSFRTEQEGRQKVRPLQRLQWQALQLLKLYQV